VRDTAMIPFQMATPGRGRRFDQAVIGQRIREARKSRGYTAESLGEAVGIGPDAMLKKEQGNAPIFMDELTRICDLLDAPRLFPFLDWDAARLVDRLLEDEGEK
jgi:transcriptional regulator with XRE-family HTH domain